jgi:hypothetical protein
VKDTDQCGALIVTILNLNDPKLVVDLTITVVICVCVCIYIYIYKIHEGVYKSFRTGCLERKLQMVHLSATRCSCIAILWVSLVSFGGITFVLLLNECLLL